MSLQGKHILLGITGGIAAYKTPELVRQLASHGAVVQVVLTSNARHFVTPTTLQAVSQRPVRDDLWDADSEAAMGHIELARWADCILIAPATAHSLARLVLGLADDLLSAICLAADCPIAAAPAMNQQMWRHAATQRNLAQLERDGIYILGPGEGPQACGEFGPGRMLEPDRLCTELTKLFTGRSLNGVRVVVTAGPTREPIDPVRYISNHSSGKQGFAVATVARDAGAEVTLICGPVGLATPQGITRIDVTTAREMYAAVAAQLDTCDIFFGVAAVADYRPVNVQSQKIKKTSDTGMRLELEQNPDIIASVAQTKRAYVVGFAAETEDTIANARAKLSRKKLDMIVLNDVSDRRIGFDSSDNAVTIITRDGEERIAISSKAEIARVLVERVATARQTTPSRQRTNNGQPTNPADSDSG